MSNTKKAKTDITDNHWSKVSEFGGLWGMQILFACYRVGGRPLFSLFLLPVIAWFYLFKSGARKASVKYLKKIQKFHGKNYLVLSFCHFIQFGHCILDKLAVWSGDELNDKNVVFKGKELPTKLIEKNEGAVVLVSHHGNFEVCRALSQQISKLKMTVLMHSKNSKKFNRMLKKAQEGMELEIIEVTEITAPTAMLLNEKYENGEFIVISGDRTPIGSDKHTVTCDFMGEQALFPQGPFVLASVLKAPLIALFCERYRGQYRVEFKEISELVSLPRKARSQEVTRLAQIYSKLLQERCEANPLQWFNFFNFWAKPTKLEDNQ